MNFIWIRYVLFICLASCFSNPNANAQVSVYGTAMLTSFGLSNGNSSDIYFNGRSAGIGGGAFYNFPIQNRLTAGIDARGSYSSGIKGGSSGAVNLRMAFVPHKIRLRPYLEIGGGFISTDGISHGLVGQQLVVLTNRVTTGALEILGGLDVRLTDTLDLRAFDYGAAAGRSSSNNTGFAFLSTGIVYHFHPTKH